MRKLLLGTTALVAAGAFVGAAQAGDDDMMAGPVTVGVAGYTTAAIGFASDTDDGTRGQEIFNHVYEIGVSGSTTLDNGITVAVSRAIGYDQAVSDTDSAVAARGLSTSTHITMSGSFGSLRIGRTESAAFNATVAAPGAGIGGMLGVNYIVVHRRGAGRQHLLRDRGGRRGMKVVYTTPNFNGLTIGASYAPEDSSDDSLPRPVNRWEGRAHRGRYDVFDRLHGRRLREPRCRL